VIYCPSCGSGFLFLKGVRKGKLVVECDLCGKRYVLDGLRLCDLKTGHCYDLE